MVLDLSHQHVEDTLLALVSRGWVSMGLGLKARQHRGLRNPSPVPTPTTQMQPQHSLPWAPSSSGGPARVAPRSDSLLERHRGEQKQPELGKTHCRTWECGQARPTPQLTLQLNFTRSEPRVSQETPLATQHQHEK